MLLFQERYWTREILQVFSAVFSETQEPENHGVAGTVISYEEHCPNDSLQAFQHYESLTMEGCIFQFFSLLAKFHAIDVETFHNCAVGVCLLRL